MNDVVVVVIARSLGCGVSLILTCSLTCLVGARGPQLMLEFPQQSGPQVTMSVRVTDDYVCAFEGPPPDGKVTCR